MLVVLGCTPFEGRAAPRDDLGDAAALDAHDAPTGFDDTHEARISDDTHDAVARDAPRAGRVAMEPWDFDGDGFDDVALSGGAYVYVFRGGPAGLRETADLRLTGPDGGAELGEALQHLGDLDGDGDDELAVGASERSAPRVFLFRGARAPATTPSQVISPPDGDGRSFGESLAAGDFNSDGRIDLAVGSWFWSGQIGRVCVYYATASGLPATPDVILRCPSPTVAANRFGLTLSCPGDTNGDDVDDLVVGSPLIDNHTGAAWVFLGSTRGLREESSVRLNAPRTGEGFGGCLAGVGDVNGDGLGDIAVCSPEGGNRSGRLSLFHGGRPTPPSEPATSFVLPFGVGAGLARITPLGDLDGDGYADLATSLYTAPNGTRLGLLGFFRGGPEGVGTTATHALSRATQADSFGMGAAVVGDVRGVGAWDLVVGAYLHPNWDQIGRAYYFRAGDPWPRTPQTVLESPERRAGARFGYTIVSPLISVRSAR